MFFVFPCLGEEPNDSTFWHSARKKKEKQGKRNFKRSIALSVNGIITRNIFILVIEMNHEEVVSSAFLPLSALPLSSLLMTESSFSKEIHQKFSLS